MNASKKIIVTGGAGFIGCNLVRRLNELGRDDILVVDELGEGDKWRNLSGLKFRDYREKDDFLRDVVEYGLRGEAEAVFHLGACSSTTEKDLSYLIGNNYEYSKTLARACLPGRVRFIYASSAATYGDGSRGYSDDEGTLDRLRPLNGYGFSKHLFDLWAWREGLLDRLVGLKYFNVYGPREEHKGPMRSMVCKGFEQIRQTGKIRLFASDGPKYGDGEQERDFVFVGDAVDMTLFFLLDPQGAGVSGIFNVGTGEAATWNRLARALFSALKLPEKIEYFPMPPLLAGKYQYHTRAETGKIRRAGYQKPLTPLEAAVAESVRGYLES